MYLATFDARHFTFTALGVDEQQAREAVALGWAAHAEYVPGVDPDYFDPDEVYVTEMVLGVPYRDGSVILPPRTRAAA